MLVNIVIVVLAFMVLSALFMIGYFFGLSDALNLMEDSEDERRLHCFECEIEMPVIEKNGSLYCKNCDMYCGENI